MTVTSSVEAYPSCLSHNTELTDDLRLSHIAAVALRFAESLDLPVVLDQVAQQTADLLDGACQVRFTPPLRPIQVQRSIVGPRRNVVDREAPYMSVFPEPLDSPAREEILITARPADTPPADAFSNSTLLLSAPLIARDRRIGMLDVVLSARDEAHLARDQQLLHVLAAYAAPAIDTADQVAQIQASKEDLNAQLTLVAHDLRSSLTILNTPVQLLIQEVRGQQELSRARLERLLTFAEAAVVQLEAQIDALTPAPAGTERRAHPADSVDLVRIAWLMVHFYQQTTSRHQIALLTDVLALPGPWSQPHLERMLGNLLSNGVKYSPAGGVICVTVGREEREQRSWATLRVQDHGIGIPAQDVPQVGQQGFRAGNVGTIPGAGFGLTSVRSVVEQYGGTLGIESVPGQHTTITIRLPLADERNRLT